MVFQIAVLIFLSYLQDGWSKGCFALDTLVATTGFEQKPISEIQVGEVVQSWDPSRQITTGARVWQVHRYRAHELIETVLETGGSFWHTSDHPVFSSRAERLVSRNPNQTRELYGLEVGWLEDQDVFEDRYGKPVKGAVANRTSRIGMHDVATLELEQYHWFFAHGIRVHNKGGGGGGGGGYSSSSHHHNDCHGDDCGGSAPLWLIILLLAVLCCVGIACSMFSAAGKGETQSTFRSYEDERSGSGGTGGGFVGSGTAIPPSGRWSGVYTEKGTFGRASEKVASYSLNFDSGGNVHGQGYDEDGTHDVIGVFNTTNNTVNWRESYHWGAVELSGIISLTGYEACIKGSYISSLGISGTLLIKAQNFRPGLRESAKAEFYAGGVENTQQAMQPPDLERNTSWGKRHKPGVVSRAVIQTGNGLKRATSRQQFKERLHRDRDRVEEHLGASRRNVAQSSRKVAPDPNYGLPPGWTSAVDNTYHTGHVYYYNEATGQTSWTRPRM